MGKKSTRNYQQLFLRLAIGSALLSAVADRFGLWPAERSAWGGMDAFIAYTGQITAFLPGGMAAFNAYAATLAEITLGVLLIIGFKTRVAAGLTGVLLLIFALSMTLTLGIKSTFDYSVWVGSAGAFLLARQPSFHCSLDRLLQKRRR